MNSLRSAPKLIIRRKSQQVLKNQPRLGERLVAAGLLNEEQLEAALRRQSSSNEQLGEILVDLGLVEEEKLLPHLAIQLGLRHVNLRDGLIDPKAVQLIPRDTAERLAALGLFIVRGELTVAMATPQDLDQIDELARVAKCRIRPVLALGASIRNLLPRCYEEGFEVDTVTADMEHGAVTFHEDAIHLELDNVNDLADGSPVINLVNYMVLQAVRQGASDIHVEPGHHNSCIRFRVDGQLREVLRPRREFHPPLVSRIKVMAKLDIAEHRQPQDGRIHIVVDNREIDLRCSTLPTVLGEKVVLRVLDRQNITFNLDELGVPPKELGEIKQMLAKPHGLMLVTGPTGSGKTTTLYSAIELIKSVHTNVVTVEDPVEYQLELINQVHANMTNSLTFAKALRAILRQDPDVIMVGEIRDGETAEVATQAALTGHLVLSTLHTNDSMSALTRLADMGIAPYKTAAAFVGVIAQRLLRTICPECKVQHYASKELLESFGYDGNFNRKFSRGEGCPNCFDTGYQGRTGIYEVLYGTRELRHLISSGADVEEIRRHHKDQGGRTLLDAGISAAERHLTSLQEVLRVTSHE